MARNRDIVNEVESRYKGEYRATVEIFIIENQQSIMRLIAHYGIRASLSQSRLSSLVFDVSIQAKYRKWRNQIGADSK